jgi:hypothetical protein
MSLTGGGACPLDKVFEIHTLLTVPSVPRERTVPYYRFL